MEFNGLTCNASNICLLSNAQSRSICSENRTGAKSGGARDDVPVDENKNPI